MREKMFQSPYNHLPQDHIAIINKHQWPCMVEFKCFPSRLFIFNSPFGCWDTCNGEDSQLSIYPTIGININYYSKWRIKRWPLPACCNPSDKPPQPAKISNVAKRYSGDASHCLSSSISFSPSLDFPFLFLLATSPSLLTAENFDLPWAGSCPR